jgi:lysophospholipase L1-like esterase
MRPPGLRWLLVTAAGGVMTYAAVVLAAAWSGLPLFTGWRNALAFAVVALLAALMLLFPLTLRGGRRLDVATMVLASIASVLSAEAALDLVVPTLARAARGAPGLDLRSREQALGEFRRAGVAVHLPGAGRFEAIRGSAFVPVSGISRVPILMSNETGEFPVYYSDEYGFHNPLGLQHTRIDVVALGDSYAHGCCVRTEEGMVARIRARYRRTLNLAMDANGPMMVLATFREHVELLRPGIVLWFFYEGNDLEDAREERRSATLRRYVDDPEFRQGLRARQADVDAFWRQRDDERSSSVYPVNSLVPGLATAKLSRMRTLTGDWLRTRRQDLDVAAELRALDALLRHIADRTQSWGGQLYFVYIPEYRRYATPAAAKPWRSDLLKLVATHGIPVIDIHEVLAAVPDPLAMFPFRRNAHFNARGHAAVADAVLAVLDRRARVDAQEPVLHASATHRDG